MTISEAAQLVIQAGAMAKGGDVFVLEMGEPVKIVDLAAEMAFLSGVSIKSEANPEGDIEIKFTGLRPGEKLYEELLVGDNCEGTEHTRIMRAHENSISLNELELYLTLLKKHMDDFNHKELFSTLKNSCIEFNSETSSVDLLLSIRNKNIVKLKSIK